MVQQKEIEFVKQLLEATQQGRLSWAPTARPDEFTTSFKQPISVIVGRVSEDHYTFRKLDDAEREMLKLEYKESSADFADPAEVVMELFEAARRQALQVDEVIDDILEELRHSGR
jgi:hypothetical protein